ncbi:MAG: YdcF family protein [Actinomycetota bacterium]|nr:YdcF family protein [Actinomycetota bacterium]
MIHPFRLLRRVVVTLVILALVYVGFTAGQVLVASRRDEARPAEAIVVLGAAQYDGEPSPVFRSRLDHAVDLYQDGVAPVVVVTGGRQEGDSFTEASAGLGYLREQGVATEDVLLEARGTTSWESLRAAARFLRPDGIDEVVLVSSPFHALRTTHIAGEVGLDGRASPTRSGPESTVTQLADLGRETLAVSAGRIIGYGRLGRLDRPDR